MACSTSRMCRGRRATVMMHDAGAQHQRRRQEGDVVAGDARGQHRRFARAMQHAGGLAGRQRREDGQPQRAADLLGGIEQAAGQAGVLVADAARPQQGDRHERQAHPQAHRQQPHQQVRDVAAVHRQLGQDQHSEGCQRDAAGGDVAHADALDERLGHAGADDDPGRHRQEGQTRAQRAVAEDLLDVERGEEEHPEHPRRDQQQHRVAHGKGADPEDAETHQGRLAAGLDREEGTQQRRRDSQQPDRPARAPAV